METEYTEITGEIKRTPKADPVTGGQMGRPHPALRKYAANYEAVSLSEALERLGARKNGQMEMIKGGLDDNSRDVDMSNDASLPTSTGDKSHLDPKGKNHDTYDPFNGRMRDENVIPENNETETMDDVRRRLMEARPGSVEAEVPVPRKKRERRKSEFYPSQIDLVPLIEQYTRMKLETEQAIKRLEASKSPNASAPPDPEGRPPRAYQEAREPAPKHIRVELSLDAMTFNVSAVDLVECRYGATLFIPTSGEAMTFVPTVGAEVVLTKQGGSPVKTHFTGISFQVPGQEVMGLAFIRIVDGKPKPQAGSSVGDMIKGKLESVG